MTAPLSIRPEEPPDDTSVVVRAGIMARDSVLATVNDAHDDYGMYMMSVEAVIGATVDDVCRSSPRIGDRYRRVRLSSFGRLRAAGFVLLATFDAPHFDVVLPDTSELTLTRLDRCFDPPIPNPGHVSGG